MTGLPSKALDVQLDLLRYYESNPGADYAGVVTEVMFTPDVNMVGAAVSDNIVFNMQVGSTDNALTAWRFGVMLHRRTLGVATTYAVTSEIVDVLESASRSIPDYALHASDLPTKYGFIYLERPIVTKDKAGRPLVIRAIAWHMVVMDQDNPETMGIVKRDSVPSAIEAGIVILLWTEPSDGRDHMHEELIRDKVRMDAASMSPPHGLWSMIGGVWAYGMVPEHKDDHALFRILMTFFRFIDEAWIDPRAIEPERALRRRAARANVQPEIKVVALRRRSQHTPVDSPTHVDWQHRWIVNGHWRNQWYPSIQQHRPKWISEYVKGPDDKPLVVHDKVFHVTR